MQVVELHSRIEPAVLGLDHLNDPSCPCRLLQVPTEYFVLVLGRHLKYSCCLFNSARQGLNEAEHNMLGRLQAMSCIPTCCCTSKVLTC